MKTTPAPGITTLLATGALSLLALTGCGSTTAPQAGETSTPATTSTASPSAQHAYLEHSSQPGLTEEELNEPIREAIATARSIDSPLYIDGRDVYWLHADIPYPERELVELEARRSANEHEPLRWVDGLGTGTLTFYRYGDSGKSYTLSVEQPSASASATQG